jgi:hypothetical protein
MKLKITEVRNQKSEVGNMSSAGLASALRPPASERGVALIITLILLSVILVMALAFLAISGREKGSVSTQTDTATTRLAADAGLAAAEGQIAANVLSTTNPYTFGLLVSTNYAPYLPPFNVQYLATNVFISPRAPVAVPNPTNPSAPLDFRFYLDLNRNGMDDPGGWVPVTDNLGNTNGSYIFEVGDPEWIGVLAHPDQPYGPLNPFVARYAFIALPVGNSLDLNAIHNQTRILPLNYSLNPMNSADDGYFRNQGVGSWELNLAAFLSDLNSDEWGQVIGNSVNGNTTYYYYQYPPSFINAGVAFNDAFALLTNRYAGNYNTLLSAQNLFGPNGVAAFTNDIDAYDNGALQTTPAGINETLQNVGWSWAGADNTNHYFKPEELFNTNETAGFGSDLLNAGTSFFGGTTASTYDRYTFYRMLSQLGTDTTPESGKMNLNYDNLVQASPNGVVSETNFYNWQPLAFFTNAADRMLKAYTAQWFQGNSLGYYTNIVGVITNWIYVAPSNYLAAYYGIHTNYFSYVDAQGHYIWNAPNGAGLTSFLGVPNALGLTYDRVPAFGITNIPVLANGQPVYMPAVQRVLQLAANIYDASTTNYYPSVFRPLFSTTNTGGYVNVFITGYTNVPFIGNPTELAQPIDASTLATTPNLPNNFPTNVYGVPWIIGAKKGFPNFNAFTMENVFQVTRKLELTRADTNHSLATFPPATYTIGQQLLLTVTNSFWVECWNSYSADYTNAPVQIVVQGANMTVLTNDEGLYYPIPFFYTNDYATSDWPGSHWQGYGSGYTPDSTSFIWQSLTSEELALPDTLGDQLYTFNPTTPFVPASPSFFVATMPLETPHWRLMITNRLQVIMLESNLVDGQFHVIDYVQLTGPDSSHDLTADIQNLYDRDTNNAVVTSHSGNNNGYDDQWDTNYNAQGWPYGIASQIGVSAQFDGIIGSPYWAQQDLTWVTNQTAGFRAFLGFGELPGMPPSVAPYIALGASSTNQQAPYGPTATVGYKIQWEADDPLVHYLASDLTDFSQSTIAAKTVTPPTYGQVNDRYWPWGGNPQYSSDLNPYNPALKDPLVYSSDSWGFPTNKLPTVGWLGRVHRGTPWQTVYLKSPDVPTTVVLVPVGANYMNLPMWAYLTGNLNLFDATNTRPVQDRLLFDLFTTAVNDNATRGTLSVNQSADQYDPVANPSAGLAAWSALFSGMVVPTNSVSGYTVINPAGPAGVNSALGTLVTNINGTRYNFINADGLAGAFEHEGDILSAPQLSNPSLFFNGLNATNGISDQMYEWLPQQMMSLVRVGKPRYVIYSYGQALKPAPNGIYLGAGPFFGMVTNYQVVSEMSTRAVMRLDTVRTNNGVITVTPPHAVIEQFNILPPD